MKSIDRLRERCDFLDGNLCDECSKKLHLIANEIEAEIAEHYMELPVDADGEPWHIGDAVYRNYRDRDLPNVVNGIRIIDSGEHEIVVRTSPNAAWTPKANKVRHDKGRMLEDVIEGAINAAFGNEAPFSVIAKKAADEIRELLGGDAE